MTMLTIPCSFAVHRGLRRELKLKINPKQNPDLKLSEVSGNIFTYYGRFGWDINDSYKMPAISSVRVVVFSHTLEQKD